MLEIHQFPCLSDNYGFLLHDPESGETAAIDTPDGEEYLRQAEAKGWTITQIWNTHWHPDHAGGNKTIVEAADAKVIAPQEVEKLSENGVSLQVIGDRTQFPRKLQQRIEQAEKSTSGNAALTLVIAANYGGRWDMTQATRKIAAAVAAGELAVDDITESTIAGNLCLRHLPEPDLFIRSGGEQRISNYLLWQLAYTELYFTDCLWPDFDVAEFDRALASYGSRQRRFGMTGDQVEVAKMPTTSTG